MAVERKKPRTAAGQNKTSFFYEVRKHKTYFIMLLPMIVYFIAFSYLPMVGIYMAFIRYDFAGGLFGSKFIGLENFKFLFSSGKLWQLTRNTMLYNLAFILIGNFMQVLVAIMLKEITGKKYVKVSQTLMFMPYFVSMVIIGTIAYNILSPQYGMLNTALTRLGLETVDVYRSTKPWPFILVAVNVWKGLGYGVVVYLAALLGIDESIYEAAYVDGANIWTRIRYITLPLLKPTVIIMLLMAVGHIMRGQFDMFYQLIGNNGQLFRSTDIIDTYVYRCINQNPDFGQGSAAGLYQSVLGLFLILGVNGIIRKHDPDNALF